jgi:hypothetical protein
MSMHSADLATFSGVHVKAPEAAAPHSTPAGAGAGRGRVWAAALGGEGAQARTVCWSLWRGPPALDAGAGEPLLCRCWSRGAAAVGLLRVAHPR